MMLRATKLPDFPDTNAITVVNCATTPPAVIATFYDAGDKAEFFAQIFISAATQVLGTKVGKS